MDDTAGNSVGYTEPRIADYGTLEQLTADAAPLLMRQLGVMGAAQMATAPATPGGGGGGGGGAIAGVGGPAEAPLESTGGEGPGIGGEVVEPAGGESPESGAPGAPGVGGVTGEPGSGGQQVAGADELPFTGLDVAATAALGAATTAAGLALRKALREDEG